MSYDCYICKDDIEEDVSCIQVHFGTIKRDRSNPVFSNFESGLPPIYACYSCFRKKAAEEKHEP
jgi:hypothetical protein